MCSDHLLHRMPWGLAVVALCACSIEPAEPTPTVEPESPESLPGLSAVTTVRGGVLELGEGERFAVAPNGDLAILDRISSEILITDSLGQVRARFGREGEGPGEIGYGHDLAFVGASSVALLDVRNERLSLFGRLGAFEGELRVEQVIRTDIAAAPGGLAVKTSGAWAPEGGGGGFRVVLLPVGRGGFGSPDPLMHQPKGLEWQGNRRFCEACQFLMPDSKSVVMPSSTADFRLFRSGIDGGVEAVYDPGRPVPHHSAESWRRYRVADRKAAEAKLSGVTGNEVRLPPPELGAPGPMRPYPEWGGIGVDHAGRLWTLSAVPPGEPPIADVYARPGRHLGTVDLPSGVRSFRVNGAWLVTYELDEVDLPVYRLFRISEAR